MKIILLVCSLAMSANVFSQKILSDTRDATTSMRTITTGTNPLYKNSFSKTVDVQSQLNVQNDSITSYDLDLISEEATGNAPAVTACSLEAENGTVITGTSAETGNPKSFRFRFSKEDFYKMIALKIKQIKITTAEGREELIKINENVQSTIANQAKVMLVRLRTGSN